jgi:hypothetical protein
MPQSSPSSLTAEGPNSDIECQFESELMQIKATRVTRSDSEAELGLLSADAPEPLASSTGPTQPDFHLCPAVAGADRLYVSPIRVTGVKPSI